MRKLNAITLDTLFDQTLCKFVRSARAGVVAVERNQHTLDTVFAERSQVVISETLNAVGGSDVAVARAPEGHGIDQRFAQDDFLRGDERFDVPHAVMRAGQVKMRRRAGAQVVSDLAAVDFGYVALLIKHRNNQRAVEVFVAAVS